MDKSAAAAVAPIRQRTQYTCMAASLSMCLKANGLDMDEDTVNKVMGAKPMQGATWEQAFAAAQHFGQRVTMVIPATVEMLKSWTDRGVPVMIAWNPEGRPWSHASVVFDVTDDGFVKVADPNIPDPAETVRVVSKDELYHKWFEQWPDYLVRRPALAVEREVSPAGLQRVASKQAAASLATMKKLDLPKDATYLTTGTYWKEFEDKAGRKWLVSPDDKHTVVSDDDASNPLFAVVIPRIGPYNVERWSSEDVTQPKGFAALRDLFYSKAQYKVTQGVQNKLFEFMDKKGYPLRPRLSDMPSRWGPFTPVELAAIDTFLLKTVERAQSKTAGWTGWDTQAERNSMRATQKGIDRMLSAANLAGDAEAVRVFTLAQKEARRWSVDLWGTFSPSVSSAFYPMQDKYKKYLNPADFKKLEHEVQQKREQEEAAYNPSPSWKPGEKNGQRYWKKVTPGGSAVIREVGPRQFLTYFQYKNQWFQTERPETTLSGAESYAERQLDIFNDPKLEEAGVMESVQRNYKPVSPSVARTAGYPKRVLPTVKMTLPWKEQERMGQRLWSYAKSGLTFAIVESFDGNTKDPITQGAQYRMFVKDPEGMWWADKRPANFFGPQEQQAKDTLTRWSKMPEPKSIGGVFPVPVYSAAPGLRLGTLTQPLSIRPDYGSREAALVGDEDEFYPVHMVADHLHVNPDGIYALIQAKPSKIELKNIRRPSRPGWVIGVKPSEVRKVLKVGSVAQTWLRRAVTGR